jgi:hypothetical protein
MLEGPDEEWRSQDATKKPGTNVIPGFLCERERSRTPNLLIRSQVLYPVELLVQRFSGFSLKSECKFNHFHSITKRNPNFRIRKFGQIERNEKSVQDIVDHPWCDSLVVVRLALCL